MKPSIVSQCGGTWLPICVIPIWSIPIPTTTFLGPNLSSQKVARYFPAVLQMPRTCLHGFADPMLPTSSLGDALSTAMPQLFKSTLQPTLSHGWQQIPPAKNAGGKKCLEACFEAHKVLDDGPFQRQNCRTFPLCAHPPGLQLWEVR